MLERLAVVYSANIRYLKKKFLTSRKCTLQVSLDYVEVAVKLSYIIIFVAAEFSVFLWYLTRRCNFVGTVSVFFL